MNSLTDNEKTDLMRVFKLQFGALKPPGDRSFQNLFYKNDINIRDSRFQRHGTSDEDKFLSFLEVEIPRNILIVCEKLLDMYADKYYLTNVDEDLVDRCNLAIHRINSLNFNFNKPSQDNTKIDVCVDDAHNQGELRVFLRQELQIPNLDKLPVETEITDILSTRLEEANNTFKNGAYLSSVVLWGSILEAVLLGLARSNLELFNRSNLSPKFKSGEKKDQPKPLKDWTLANLIDTAHDTGLLQKDVKEFGDKLREFRNYIHPNKQLESNFIPDIHTAEICFQVLKAALADVAGER